LFKLAVLSAHVKILQKGIVKDYKSLE